jgi:hypothetical protein
MKKLFKAFVIFIVFNFTNVNAQGISGNPIFQKWKQIETDYFRLIFQPEAEKQAQSAVNIMNYVASHETKSVGDKRRKLDILLKNNTVIPNGFVAMSPFRSEFYFTPSQNPYAVGANEFVNTLAIHEYRHVLQMSNERRGLAWLPYIFSGDQGLATYTAFIVPNWYYEGDAVTTETAITSGGRGRIPQFTNITKANIIANEIPEYKQVRVGSYVDLLPNHYEFGYLMINEGREIGGNNIWTKINKDALNLKGILFPYSRATNRHLGLSTDELYDKSMETFKKKYLDKLSKTDIYEGNKLTEKVDVITNYTHPISINGKTYALKSSFDKITEIVEIGKNGEEDKFIANPGSNVDHAFSTNGNQFVWTEIENHFRWDAFNYSNIVVFDKSTGKKRYLTSKAKLFSPAINESGDRIVAVEYKNNAVCQLVILDSKTGEIITSLPNRNNEYIMSPTWNGNNIFYSSRKGGKFNICSINANSHEHKSYIEPINQIISKVSSQNGKILFSASFSGIDNIYCLNTTNKKLEKVTSVKVGAYSPSLDATNNSIIFENFTNKGTELRTIELSSAKPYNEKLVGREEMTQFNTKAIQEEGGDIYKKIDAKTYEVTDYNKLTNLIDVHSWGLNITDQEAQINLNSDNILNDFSFTGTYSRNFNENTNNFNVSAEYAGFVIKTKVYAETAIDKELKIGSIKTNWDEYTAGLNFSLPINFSKGVYSRGMNFSTGINYTKIKYDGASNKNLKNFNFSYNLYNIKHSALQNMGPRAGQSIYVSYNKSLFEKIAQELEIGANVYLPGLCNNHNIHISPSFKWNGDLNNYRYTDTYVYARGYEVPDFYNNITKISVDYNFPIAYPQFGLSGIYYLNRLTGKIFYDYSILNIDSNENKLEYSTVGAEIVSDINFVNLLPFNVGVRFNYRLNDKLIKEKEDKFAVEAVFRAKL